ncbi:MAG: hypothetical protein GY749_19850 [Desulfobacteraceae bacterium]|nr:hypothetical protein [Desulfobacteraceae bacterium]
MLNAAETKFEAAGIDISRLRTTGDAAYFSQNIAAFCRGECSEEAEEIPSESDTATVVSLPDACLANEDVESYDPVLLPTITGIFRGKDSYVFEIDGEIQRAGRWRKDFKDRLTPGCGTDRQPVYRTEAVNETFGEVILVFYIPKGKRAVSYLIVVGRPLRSSEALCAFAFHHRIEEFWKLLKNTLELGEMHLRDREVSHACVSIKIIAYLVVNTMKQNLRKLGHFKNVTINKLVRLCPKFVDVLQIFKDGMIPDKHTLAKALA